MVDVTVVAEVVDTAVVVVVVAVVVTLGVVVIEVVVVDGSDRLMIMYSELAITRARRSATAPPRETLKTWINPHPGRNPNPATTFTVRHRLRRRTRHRV